MVLHDEGVERGAGGSENAFARHMRREVRWLDDDGVDDERVEALCFQEIAHELKFDAFGVESADEEDGHAK